MSRRLGGVALASIALVLGGAASAHASGMTTHAFMADKGRDGVTSADLRDLLDGNRASLLSGAVYPDGGYAVSSYPGGNFGEITHWERFVNAYAEVLRTDAACAPILDPDGPCAADVAHLMGVAAHGVGDEMWDWMFEPQARDRGESPVHPLYTSGLPGFAELSGYPPGSLANNVEYTMDLVAIVDHLRFAEISATLPSTDRLLAAYAAIGRHDITRDGILAGHSVAHGAIAAERAAAAIDYLRVKQTMPWMSAHMYDESGGVLDVAAAASKYYEALWAKLGGSHPAPVVSATHPEPGERGVPWEWSGVSASPGPNGGGAQQRIIAVLSNALPLEAGNRLPEESIRLIEVDTGLEVALRDGFPRSGPYHSDDGTHSIAIMPAANLAPCTWYQVEVTGALRDHAGAELAAPYRWRFQTRSAPGVPKTGGCRDVADPAPYDGAVNEPTPGPHVTDALHSHS